MLNRIPWKSVLIGSAVLTVLVVLRTVATIGRSVYWHQDVIAQVRQDPWVYIGLAAAAIFILSWILLPRQMQQPEKTKNEEP